MTYLLAFFIRHQWLLPRTPSEVTGRDQARLTTSITSSRRSAYAISSNWLDLWRTSTFRYYLHLDATMSLLAYSLRRDSPLERLSTDPADQEEFFEYGWDLIGKIGAGQVPMRKHRLRLLIYPQWAYDTYTDEVNHLIRSHSAARIPCIPLVAETLAQKLGADDQRRVELLAGALGQTPMDKLPPLSRRYDWRGRRALKRSKEIDWLPPVFPDMLLIDSSYQDGAVWWYSADGHVDQWELENNPKARDAVEVFQLVCKHAKSSVWSNYASNIIGGVAVAATPSRLESEAFFAQRHYSEWLNWIEINSDSEMAAAELYQWLEDEAHAMQSALVEHAASRGGAGTLDILDVGCGFGRHVVDIFRNEQNSLQFRAVGVDVNASMISEAAQSAKSNDIHHLTSFLVDDAAELKSCRDEEFDFAICMTNTLGNLPKRKQERMIRRLRNVLKPGGRLFISTYSTHSIAARVASYKAIGLDVEVKGDKVMAAEGLESEAFSTSRLRGLLEENGLRLVGVIDASSSIGLKAIAERP